MNIIVTAPSYTHASGGIRVLHYFGWLASLLGNRVQMDSPYCNPAWNFYSKTVDTPDFRLIPEIAPISENDGISTVRWVLYFPGKLGNAPSQYPLHEYVVAYHKTYLDAAYAATKQKKIDVFMLPYIDMSGMNDDIKRYNAGAVWYGKSPVINTPETKDLPIITRVWPYPRYEMIKFLKSTITIYSFDRFSVLNSEAKLCGCEVMLWNGEKFETYCSNDYDGCIMDISQNLIDVSKFLETVKKHFGIKSK